MIVGDVVPWHETIPEAEVCRERLALLSEAEAMIVSRMAAGYSQKEVARMRGAAKSTINNQLCAVYRKLGVTCCAQALAVIFRATLEAA